MKTKLLPTILLPITILALSLSLLGTSSNQNAKAVNTYSSNQSSILKNKTQSVNLVKLPSTPINRRFDGVNLSQFGQTKGIYKYEYAGQSNGSITLAPGQNETLVLELKNTGDTAWENGTFHLGTSHSQDRASSFANATWLSANRIGINEDTVEPGNIAEFKFTVIAPQASGVYYEYFRPVVDGTAWLSDVGIYWKITVKDVNENESALPVFNKIAAKKIVVKISTQNLKCYEGTDVVCDFIISSGLPGLDTPTGNFKIERKRDVAYSSAYDLYMNYWMAFTSNEAYGIHELPYWKYSWGIVTEGANHLGVKVSHGCVRLGIGSAKQVYDWAPVGTPVEIVN